VNLAVSCPLHLACSAAYKYDAIAAQIITQDRKSWVTALDKGDGAGNTALMLATKFGLPKTVWIQLHRSKCWGA
jgi:hypothetical protein